MRILVVQYPSGLIKCMVECITVNYSVGKGSSIKEALGDLVVQKVVLGEQTIECVSEARLEELVDKCKKLKYKK